MSESTPRLVWTRSSVWLMSAFLAVIGLILVVWWPLVVDYVSTFDPRYPVWAQIDWLLIGVFAVMSLLIMAGADVRTDWVILVVGLGGGLVIETWGTQTQLWTYYTLERPPLWIIPAWPIASLSIDRLYRFLNRATRSWKPAVFARLYWIVLPAFLAIMLAFVAPTLGKSLTWGALALCVLITLTPSNARAVVLAFAAGAGLGYFLELWGTTRACWTYYTGATPPLFAVLAHGMAAVAFWRTAELVRAVLPGARTRGTLPAPSLSPGGPSTEAGSASEPHVTPPLSA